MPTAAASESPTTTPCRAARSQSATTPSTAYCHGCVSALASGTAEPAIRPDHGRPRAGEEGLDPGVRAQPFEVRGTAEHHYERGG
jgi:hypothetical protein